MKFKNIIFIFSIIIIGSSCKKNNNKETNSSENLKSHIEINDIKSSIPNFYKDDSKIIFIDENNNEKVFSTSFVEEQKGMNLLDHIYTSDYILSKLVSEETNPIIIELRGQAGYTDEREIQKLLSINFSPQSKEYPGSSSFTWVFFENGNPKEYLNGIKIVKDEISFFGNEFKNVYGVVENIIHDSYGEVLFNQEFGIVSFLDNENVRWVFYRFE